SEMPEQENGRMEGFQLWLNLPARDKLVAPAYRDIAANQIPAFTTVEHVLVRVVAGESHGVPGAVQRPHTAPLYLDVQLPVAASFQQPLPAAHNAFLHVYRGEISVAGVTVQAGQMAILDNEAVADGVSLTAQSDSCLLLIAGQPLREPIVQHGPFVMNSTEEIRQAFADYRAGKFA
ncbi:MAG: pirin family protein, partial [Sterolibacterium sp.]|nr:pirin family protein [Sterolibacterium sp.]